MSDVRQPPGGGGSANPGWYRDPWGQSAWRWWDGWQWTGWLAPPLHTPQHLVTRAIQEQAAARASGPATVEPPAAERPAEPERPAAAWPPPMPATAATAPSTPAVPGTGYAWPPVQGTFPAAGPPAGPVPPLTSAQRPEPAPPAEPVPAGQRRRVVAELLLVLAVFPLPYTVSALVDLVSSLVGNGSGQRTPVLIKFHPGASFPFELALVLIPLFAAGLAWYLLSVPGPVGSRWTERGEGGLGAIGLDRTNLRGDLALVVVVFVLAFLIPIYGGGILLHALGVKAISPSTGGVPKYFVLIDVANGLVSGVVEEIVVLGYLVRRLEQLALPNWAVVVIAVAVRGSYHLYYGLGVLPILVWATVAVLLYRRYRRLLPFIVVHMLWDSSLFVAGVLSLKAGGAFLVTESLVLGPVSFIAWLAWRHLAPAPHAGRS